MSKLVALLRQQLFVYREMIAWLDKPFHPPPGSEPVPQQQLLLAGMEPNWYRSMISILSRLATWSRDQPFVEAFSHVFSNSRCSAQLASNSWWTEWVASTIRGGCWQVSY